MKKFLAALLIGLSLVSITLDASAARLGGGASFPSKLLPLLPLSVRQQLRLPVLLPRLR